MKNASTSPRSPPTWRDRPPDDRRRLASGAVRLRTLAADPLWRRADGSGPSQPPRSARRGEGSRCRSAPQSFGTAPVPVGKTEPRNRFFLHLHLPHRPDTLARIWPDLSTRPIDGGIAHELSVTTKNVNGEILPGSKTGEHKKRRVYVPEPAAEDLELWRPHSAEVFIFGRASDGQPWTKTGYKNWRSRAPRKGKEGVKRRPRCFNAGRRPGPRFRCGPMTSGTPSPRGGKCGLDRRRDRSPARQQEDVVNKVYRHMLDAAPRPERERRSINDYIRQARGTLPGAGKGADDGVNVRDLFGISGV